MNQRRLPFTGIPQSVNSHFKIREIFEFPVKILTCIAKYSYLATMIKTIILIGGPMKGIAFL